MSSYYYYVIGHIKVVVLDHLLTRSSTFGLKLRPESQSDRFLKTHVVNWKGLKIKENKFYPSYCRSLEYLEFVSDI